MKTSTTAARFQRPSLSRIVRSFAVGSLSGLAATWIMINAQSELEARFAPAPPPDKPPTDPPPVRMAFKLTQLTVHRTLPDEDKARGAALVSYGFGALIAGGWSALCEIVPMASFARGAGFGLVLWLAGDETMAPLFGVADPPSRTPKEIQAIDGVSHVLYGMSADVLRRYLK